MFRVFLSFFPLDFSWAMPFFLWPKLVARVFNPSGQASLSTRKRRRRRLACKARNAAWWHARGVVGRWARMRSCVMGNATARAAYEVQHDRRQRCAANTTVRYRGTMVHRVPTQRGDATPRCYGRPYGWRGRRWLSVVAWFRASGGAASRRCWANGGRKRVARRRGAEHVAAHRARTGEVADDGERAHGATALGQRWHAGGVVHSGRLCQADSGSSRLRAWRHTGIIFPSTRLTVMNRSNPSYRTNIYLEC